MPSPMQRREDDRGQAHYGGRGPSCLLHDSTVGFVARGDGTGRGARIEGRQKEIYIMTETTANFSPRDGRTRTGGRGRWEVDGLMEG